jgi:hypothetical protein
MSFGPSQIDDANLNFWYSAEQHPNGVYYRVKPGAPAGFLTPSGLLNGNQIAFYGVW